MNIFKKLFNIKKTVKCENCSCSRTNRGYWGRGWNDRLNQATGDYGYMCDDCIHITWEKNLDEYLDVLPHWCSVSVLEDGKYTKIEGRANRVKVI